MKLAKTYEQFLLIQESYEDIDRRDYLKWKKKNVSYRWMSEVGEENGGAAMLGRGLYTACLSNKSMTKNYGTRYFVVGGVPKNPKIFNTVNDWEIWLYNTLIAKYSKEKVKEFPDKRDFDENTTIEKEIMKLGYDGVLISGREMVNYTPGQVYYFKTEKEVYDYYRFVVLSK